MKSNKHLFDLYWEDILIAKVLPRLTLRECYNFRRVSKTCLQLIDMHFSKLKSLKLMYSKLTPLTFRVLATTCTKLTVLNLCKCAAVTDADLIPMLLNNPTLLDLNLSDLENVTTQCLQPVILHCKDLKTLKLANCPWLTTGALEALSLHQSKLEHVDLSYCASISESSILLFIKKFRNLITLTLENNNQVTDKCLEAISKYSTVIRILNVSWCTEITNIGIRALTYNCPNLVGLSVRGCVKVTENSLCLIRGRVHLDRKPVFPIIPLVPVQL